MAAKSPVGVRLSPEVHTSLMRFKLRLAAEIGQDFPLYVLVDVLRALGETNESQVIASIREKIQ
jgi:hypothetical protein